jgi:hypothetical protein
MPSDQPVQKGQNAGNSSTEPKTRGANRSTKVAGKLKVLPEQPELVTVKAVDLPGPPRDHDETVGTTGDSDEGDIDDDDDDEPGDVEVSGPRKDAWCNFSGLKQVYNQISLIPDGTAKRDALRLTKKKAKSLPRVTAYATAT